MKNAELKKLNKSSILKSYGMTVNFYYNKKMASSQAILEKQIAMLILRIIRMVSLLRELKARRRSVSGGMALRLSSVTPQIT